MVLLVMVQLHQQVKEVGVANNTNQQSQQRTKQQPTEVRLPLIGAMTNRSSDASKDQRFINYFPETRKVEAIESTRIFINKRPGLTLIKTVATGLCRGSQWFRSMVYSVIGNTVYADTTALFTVASGTGQVGIQLGNSSTLGNYLFICDGVTGWIIKSDGSVVTVDPTNIRSIVISAAGSGYTNGTYSCTFTGGDGSGLAATYTVTTNKVTSINITNRGTGYTSSPVVNFPSGGGTGASAIANVNAFPSPHIPIPTFIDGYILVAQGSDVHSCNVDDPTSWSSGDYISAEMFPDPIVGLCRQNNQVVVFGQDSTEFFYDAANTAGSPLSRNESTVLQMGCAFPYAVYQNENSFIFVGQSDSGGRAIWKVDGFNPKKVSDEFIDRILDKETNPTAVTGFGFRVMGHLFYLLNLPTLNRTLVYDTEEKLWHEWSTWTGTSHAIFGCNSMVDSGLGYSIFLDSSNGNQYQLDTTNYTDNGNVIRSEIVTNRFDMDTYKRKFMSNLRVVGDSYTNGSIIQVRWSDDDYNTWSNYKTISTDDSFPNWTRLGSFRRRAFNLVHTDNTASRLESIEVTYWTGVA
jgi:hypothetical protein